MRQTKNRLVGTSNGNHNSRTNPNAGIISSHNWHSAMDIWRQTIMVRLTKIYTKTGDDGTTALGDNSRVSKTDPLIEAYSTVDEANAHIGMVLAFGDIGARGTQILNRIQNMYVFIVCDFIIVVLSMSSVGIIYIYKFNK